MMAEELERSKELLKKFRQDQANEAVLAILERIERKIDEEIEAARDQRERERETLNRIDQYLRRFGIV